MSVTRPVILETETDIDTSSIASEPTDLEVLDVADQLDSMLARLNEASGDIPDETPQAVIQSFECGFFLIDPTNMSPLEASITTQFLIFMLKEYGVTLIYKDASYVEFECIHPETAKPLIATLSFDYDIAWYLSNKHPEQDRFKVVGDGCIGKGSTGEVREILGKLKPSPTGTLFYQSDRGKPKDKKWVAKYEFHNHVWTAAHSRRAFDLAKANKKLGLKHPVWVDAENEHGISVTVMRRLKDYDLDKILAIDDKHPGYLEEFLKTHQRWDMFEVISLVDMGMLLLSELDLLKYSLAIAEAYKEQVVDINVVHRDFKPENIMIDLAKGPCSAAITLIDYVQARRVGELGMERIFGSPGFIAPEVYEGKMSAYNECDIFSLACVLAQWYGDFSAYAECSEEDDYGYWQSVNKEFTSLASHTPPEIKVLLNLMVAYDPNERPDINKVIATYKMAILYKEIEEIEGVELTPPSLRKR